MMNKIGYKLGVLAISASLLAFAGCNQPTQGNNNWKIQGVDGPHLTFQNNVATIWATFTNVHINAGATVSIPQMPNSTIEVSPEVTSGGLLFQATISAVDVAKLANLNLLPPQTLPGGRPLPGVAGGTMPALAIQVPALDDIVFYIGPRVFGVFGPVDFGLDQIIGTFQYYDEKHNLEGNISIVGQDANKKNSGFLLLIDMPTAAGVMMREGKLDLNELF